MVMRKFNYFRFFVVIAILVAMIFGIVMFVRHFNYKKTYEYKLLNIGYSQEDVSIIENKLKNPEKEKVLSLGYNTNLIPLLKEKYFIFSNLDKYIEYKNDNKDESYDRIVAIINTEANIDWLDEEKSTDITKGELMLVNRLYGLNSDYEVEDLVKVPLRYAYEDRKLSNVVLEPLQNLCEDGRAAGYVFVVDGAYRSYKDQESTYNRIVSYNGRSEADKIAARPGHSEYETGLSLELVPNKAIKEPKLSEEYLWLRENAHKYGFIFRFDADKEYLTGFKENIWRLRYVGVDAASMIHNEGICFEEYYAYFVRGKSNE